MSNRDISRSAAARREKNREASGRFGRGTAPDAPPLSPRRARLVFIGDDGTWREVHVPGETVGLDPLQALVDGSIELLAASVQCRTGRRSVDVWMNDEGRLRQDFHRNPHAKALLGSLDELIGPAVVCASTFDGESVGLSEVTMAAVRQELSRSGATELSQCSVAEAAEQQNLSRRTRVDLGYMGHGVEPFMRFVEWPDGPDQSRGGT